MLLSPTGLRPKKGYAGDAQQKLKTAHPTSRQRGSLIQQIRNCLKLIKEGRRKIGPLTSRQIGRLTVGRYMTLTLTLTSSSQNY
jgi:hypothetical protein